MSFSEYNGSKSKVSTAVGRILRNAQENLPKIPNAQGGSALSSFLKSISSNNSSGSERLNKQGYSSSTNSTSTSSSTTSKFGFQKLRLGSGEKKRGTNQHSELLDNQQDQEDSDGDDSESDPRGQFMLSKSKSALIDSHSSPTTMQKQKKWRF